MNMSKNKQSVLRSIANSGGAATVRGGQAQVGADSLVKDGLLRQTGSQGYAKSYEITDAGRSALDKLPDPYSTMTRAKFAVG